jgi:hypothetical protein
MTERYLDLGSWVVIAVTLVLFIAALFFKGFTHDILLEAGVFLVSLKLIIMAYKTSASSTRLNERLDRLDATLARMEDRLAARAVAPSASR